MLDVGWSTTNTGYLNDSIMQVYISVPIPLSLCFPERLLQVYLVPESIFVRLL